MCGIAGIVSRSDRGRDLEVTKTVLAHRGPDAVGCTHHRVGDFYTSVLHRRLAIVDLTESANQPFFTPERDAFIAYNGEIYNYIELRAELEELGVTFTTASDTEVLLQALRNWGVEPTLAKLNGMWAFAYYDLTNGSVTFARDRFGIKPLYYFMGEQEFCFGSEIKAVLQLAKQKMPINRRTASRYLTQHLLESDPAETFFDGVLKLPAGHYAQLDLRAPALALTTIRYYRVSPRTVACDFRDAASELRDLLVDAVSLQLRSDVPVGVLLSGGLDSSAIACIAHREVAGRPAGDLGLLSLTSEGSPYDEGPYVSLVENHIGRTSTRVDTGNDPAQFLDLLGEVQWANDEPIISFSSVAYYMMMARARELGIKVWLTGQGADEIFCGYKKYLGFYLMSLLRGGKVASFGKEVVQFGMNGGFIHDVQWTEMKRYIAPRHGLQAIGPALDEYDLLPVALGVRTLVERQVFDIEQTSVPALLHYEDRLSMAHSREVRVPFLDHRIVEFGLSCPDHFRIGTGWSKRVLRAAVNDYLPRDIVWRKDKNGFGVPQIEWLKTGLRQSITSMLEGDCLMYDMQLVDKRSLLQLYGAYCSSYYDSIPDKKVFSAVALEVWLRRYAGYLA